MPYSQPEQTAANLPLPLDDPEAVWWVSSGSVDVFFIQLEPGMTTGRRRHLCRVEEGGSIFAISGVRGRAGGGLLAVGAGQRAAPEIRAGRSDPAQLRGRPFRAGGRAGRRLGDPRWPCPGPIRRRPLPSRTGRRHDLRISIAILASACARGSPGSGICWETRCFSIAFPSRTTTFIPAFR